MASFNHLFEIRSFASTTYTLVASVATLLSEGNHSRITLYRQGTNKCCVVFALLKTVKTQTQLFTLSYVRTEGKSNDAVITQGAEKKRKLNDNKLHKVETSC